MCCWERHVPVPRRLLLRHVDIPADRVTVVTADERGRDIAEEHGVRFLIKPVTKANYRAVFSEPDTNLGPDDFLINVSVNISSVRVRLAGVSWGV